MDEIIEEAPTKIAGMEVTGMDSEEGRKRNAAERDAPTGISIQRGHIGGEFRDAAVKVFLKAAASRENLARSAWLNRNRSITTTV